MANRLHVQVMSSVVAIIVGCGGNAFQTGEAADPAEDATIALEKHDTNKAIRILETALVEDPGNVQLQSILALAYAQRAGVEPLDFAQRFAEDPNAGNGDITAMFTIMPEATDDNIHDIDRAVDILTIEMDPDQRQPGDQFKLAIFQTAAMVIHTKILDTNLDGELSVEEIANLSSIGAADLLAQIATARSSLSATSDDDASAKAADSLGKYEGRIDEAPGATREEKLKNYLANNGKPIPSESPSADSSDAPVEE